MRERINVELSDYFQNELLLPEAIRDYKTNFRELILLNKAYALMLERINLLEKEDCGVILKGLEHVADSLKEEDIKGSCEDLYFNVEQALIAQIGIKAGGKLHTGRSRNDLYSALTRIEVRKTSWLIMDKVIELQEVLLAQARGNLDTVITGYTHLQPAQPTTLAHYDSALIYALSRDFERLQNAYKNTNASPYGAAAFAGSGFPVDRQYLSDLLGFDGVLPNSLDCIASKDFLVQMEMAYSILMLNVSRFAEDMYIWATDEFGLLDVGGEVAICSSIMPQKKNPVCFEYARAKSAHTLGAMVSAAAVLKGAPFSNNEDIFEAQAFYEEGVTQTLQGIGIFTEGVRHSRFRKDKAMNRARRNFSTVTCLADHLVKEFSISFEESHQIVGSMAGEIMDRGLTIDAMNSLLLAQVSKEVLGLEIMMNDEAIRQQLDPYKNILQKKSSGSPNPESVKAMLLELEQILAAEKDWLADAKKRVAKGYARLEDEENRILRKTGLDQV